MSKNKFTSRYGIDLGKLETISISGNKTLQDKVLILKRNPITGDYVLEPRDIGIQHGINDTVLILKDDETNYSNSFIINNIFSESDTIKTLHTLSIDFRNKKRGMLSIKGKLFARETEQSTNIINFYMFTTGENVSYENVQQNKTLNRHLYDKMLFVFNDYYMNHIDDVYKDFSNLQTVKTQKYYFQPLFTNIKESNSFLLNIDNNPYIEIDHTTDGIFNIHIKCTRLKNNTSTVNWFGELEVILTAT